MKIIVSPFSRRLKNGKINPKNFPHWEGLVSALKIRGHKLTQVGLSGEPGIGCHDFKKGWPLKKLEKLVNKCDLWISVDNFFQHFCWSISKPGIVIFGPSDPKVFGHGENVNMFKDRKYLRQNQFDIWDRCEYREEVFPNVEAVLNEVEIFKRG